MFCFTCFFCCCIFRFYIHKSQTALSVTCEPSTSTCETQINKVVEKIDMRPGGTYFQRVSYKLWLTCVVIIWNCPFVFLLKTLCARKRAADLTYPGYSCSKERKKKKRSKLWHTFSTSLKNRTSRETRASRIKLRILTNIRILIILLVLEGLSSLW